MVAKKQPVRACVDHHSSFQQGVKNFQPSFQNFASHACRIEFAALFSSVLHLCRNKCWSVKKLKFLKKRRLLWMAVQQGHGRFQRNPLAQNKVFPSPYVIVNLTPNHMFVSHDTQEKSRLERKEKTEKVLEVIGAKTHTRNRETWKN